MTTAGGWDVLDEDAGVLTREYGFAHKATARMITARMKDGRLLAMSPSKDLPPEALAELNARGSVGALVAPNGLHHLGLPAWRAAFPDAGVYAGEITRRRLAKKYPQIAFQPLEALAALLPDNVRVLEVPGTRLGETWLTVGTRRGPIWYVSDSCFSFTKPPPVAFARLLFRLFDTAPGFKINGIQAKLLTKDKPAYRRFFLTTLDRETPSVVVTAHGAVVDAPGTGAELRRMAEARL